MMLKTMHLFRFIPGVLLICATFELYDLAQATAPPDSGDLELTLTTSGSYAVQIRKTTWLRNAPTFFRANGNTYSTENSTLKLLQTSAIEGSDKFGDWQGLCFQYVAGTAKINATVRKYNLYPMVIFSQIYINGASGTSMKSQNDVIGGFPGFLTMTENVTLGYLTYAGSMFGCDQKTAGKWNDQFKSIHYGLVGGPLAIFDEEGRTIIISPFNHFMAASSMYNANSGTIHWGVMGGVDEVPPFYQYSTVLYYGRGINQAFNEWGTLMRFWYNRDDTYKRDDITLNYIGYWTDNGAYYYYNTENGSNYEITIVDIAKYIKTEHLSFKYMQYDSWWYYKGSDGGTKTWDPRGDVFPDTWGFIQAETDLPIAAHNRWWSKETTYAKQNGGQFDFIINGSDKAVPVDPNFWPYLLGYYRNYDLVMYEQDWLYDEFIGSKAMLTNISLGETWLSLMNKGAIDTGMTVQYCMSFPRQALSTLEYSAVTQARVSEDYHPGEDNWKIGITSMLAWALGVAPSKDTFWTTSVQPGNPYSTNTKEPYTVLNSIVATLSTGPVGPSDMIGAVNASVLMRCCNKDGNILKPSKPATAIDRQLLKYAALDMAGPDGEVWSTYSDIPYMDNGEFRYGIVLAAEMKSIYKLYPRDACIHDESHLPDTPLFVYKNGQSKARKFSSNEPLVLDTSCSQTDPCLYHISPQLDGRPDGTFLLGELNKWVPISPQRIDYVQLTDKTTNVKLRGVPGETFDFWFSYKYQFSSVKCVINSSGSALFMFEMNDQTCN